jgi:hypothetical protein
MGRKNPTGTGLADTLECPLCELPILNKRYLMDYHGIRGCVICVALMWAEDGKDPRSLENRAKKLHRYRQKQLDRLAGLLEKLDDQEIPEQ